MQRGNTAPDFDESKEEFTLYVERLEQFFEANDIDNTKRVATFLSALNPATYKLLRNSLQPKLPKNESFENLVAVLSEHYKPTPITIAERFKFHRRNQEANESIANYIVELKRLASTCSFGEFLEEAIRDRFVCGLRDDAIQKRLLAKKKLLLSDAHEIALAMESAEQNIMTIKQPTMEVNAVDKIPALDIAEVRAVNKQFGNINRQKSQQEKNSFHEQTRKCFRCGGPHFADRCRFIKVTCHNCNKMGHIASVCMSGFRRKEASAKMVKSEEVDTDMDAHVSTHSLYTINHKKKKHKDYIIAVNINGHSLDMILDTAADISTVSEKWAKTNIPHVQFEVAKVRLQDYGKNQIAVAGQVSVDVTYEHQTKCITIVIVKGDRPCLFGKDLIKMFKLNWDKIFSLNQVVINEKGINKQNLDTLIQQHNALFTPNKLPIRHFKAEIALNRDANPVFCRARPVPYSLKAAVEKEICKSRDLGIWVDVDHAKWATPIVVVPKKTNEVRLCGDFKVTLNPCIDVNKYPLPTQQDLFSTLSGGVYFTKLDLRHAYQQVELEYNAQKLLTLNTHIGLVRPTRLLYGISSASAIFQQIMDQILHGLRNVICYQDDILVTGKSEEEHLKNLDAVFTRLREYNVTLNFEKCEFLKSEVEYLGHMIDKTGIHPTDEKIAAIKAVKRPTNITELRSFLGLLNYYIKFIKDSSSLLHPLHSLLRKDVSWIWNSECEVTFEKCKQILTSETILVHYDANRPLKLQCDASPFGLGAVLSHETENGQERPVAYASRSLTKAEQGYSQVEREALAIIFGLKKYQQYLFGRHFTIVTDHRPLLTLLGPTTAVPALAAARIQRWALLLASFQYKIEYKKGCEHLNADALSRLPMDEPFEIEEKIYKLSYVDELPVTSDIISKATGKDSVLSQIVNYVKFGWKITSEELQPFYIRRHQLALDGGCITWGMRVVIPVVLRPRILELLHETHQGVNKMKAIARSHVWWPGLDQQIEKLSKDCHGCQQNLNMPNAATLQSWVWPKAPWERIHLDFAQKGEKLFMVLVDAHSKWIEVVVMPSISSTRMIEELRKIFARYGLPLELVSDNGPQLISEEFKSFLKCNNIKHTLVPTYHPQSNGAAERSVQSFKRALSKMGDDERDNTTLNHKIARYLLTQHTTPHTTTGRTPSELFMGRNIRTFIDMVHVNLSSFVEEQQMKQKKNHDRSHSKTTQRIEQGNRVLIRQFGQRQPKWIEGTTVKQCGSRTWRVSQGEKERLVHVDQMRKSDNTNTEQIVAYEGSRRISLNEYSDQDFTDDEVEIGVGQEPSSENATLQKCRTQEGENQNKVMLTPIIHGEKEKKKNAGEDIVPRRNPVRDRKAPYRLDL